MKRKLIEVALPLDKINAAASKEKSIRHGHPSTLHVWWSRKPLAACRAVLFASLVDDPSAHEDRFPTEEAQQIERDRLFAILEDLVKWENSTNETILVAARKEIEKSTGNLMPAIYDPFCGGGSIPLEAQRLGLAAFGSDLNPVAVLITRAMIELPSKFANRCPVNPIALGRRNFSDWPGTSGLAEDVRYYGDWIRRHAFERAGQLYPKTRLPASLGGRDATVIAWIWARTVRCPNPACGALMPLTSKFVLSGKGTKQTWAQPIVDTTTKSIRFEVTTGTGEVPKGTVDRRGARCLACGEPAKLDYVRAEGKAGRIDPTLLAKVVESASGRLVLSPDPTDIAVALSARPAWEPTTSMPGRALGFRVQAYGIQNHADLFTRRQLTLLTTLADLVGEARNQAIADGATPEYADAIAVYMAIAVSKTAVFHNTLSRWRAGETKSAPAFGRQALPIVWDFAEVNPFAGAGGDFEGVIDGCVRVLKSCSVVPPGKAFQRDAMEPLQDPGMFLVCTDPPYYDNIGYADLSDFFYIWLRHALREVVPDLFGTVLVPKSSELIATPHRFEEDMAKARDFFESGFARAFDLVRKSQNPDYPLIVFYAFKQAENEEDEDDGEVVASTGWETMLEGLVEAKFEVTGTWPMRTEGAGRLRAMASNVLASSIVLVCRPRPALAQTITEMDFQQALRAHLPKAVRTMQQESVAPADLAQASIGPGMALYSKCDKVLGPDGKRVPVRKALEMINRVLDEVLSEQEGEFDSDTRFALAWFQQFGMRSGSFGTADVLSRAMNIGVTGMETAGILEAKAGTVRLLKWEELPEDWDPEKDRRLTVWEMTHHLIRLMYKESDAAAARVLAKLGDEGEKARDLAYRLYQICERSKWSQEAQPYNALVVAWPNLTAEARRLEKRSTPEQMTL
ncbi:MAG: DUF1156 domain-containing protein [Bryobacteraceae bacterium]|nr:DUF1156 domain-containing protein [Bryobacteraceae bacterium]